MTPDQIKEEQEELKAMFSKDQLELLRKLGQRGGGKGPPKKSDDGKPKVISTS